MSTCNDQIANKILNSSNSLYIKYWENRSKCPSLLQNDFFHLSLLKMYFYVPYKFILVKFGPYLCFWLVFCRNTPPILHVIIFEGQNCQIKIYIIQLIISHISQNEFFRPSHFTKCIVSSLIFYKINFFIPHSIWSHLNNTNST